jgi:hypothetical protein
MNNSKLRRHAAEFAFRVDDILAVYDHTHLEGLRDMVTAHAEAPTADRFRELVNTAEEWCDREVPLGNRELRQIANSLSELVYERHRYFDRCGRVRAARHRAEADTNSLLDVCDEIESRVIYTPRKER